MGKFKKNFEEETQPQDIQTVLNPDIDPDVEQAYETVYIDMDRIRPSNNNEFSQNEIEELADTIKMAGRILQNLIVKPISEDGYYYLTTGERRWRAAQLLKNKGEYPKEYNNKVPCTIMNPEEVPLPLNSENKELFSILVTNKYRDKTDGDRLVEMRGWKKIFDELREQGIEYIRLGGSTDQKEGTQDESVIQIKGVPTRKLLSEQMGISTGQVGRYEYVEKRGSSNVLNQLMNNKIDLSTAEEIAELEKEEQDQLLERIGGKEKVTRQEIKEKKNEIHSRNITIAREEFQKELDEISNKLTEDAFSLSVDDYKKYRKCITQLRKVLGIM